MNSLLDEHTEPENEEVAEEENVSENNEKSNQESEENKVIEKDKELKDPVMEPQQLSKLIDPQVKGQTFKLLKTPEKVPPYSQKKEENEESDYNNLLVTAIPIHSSTNNKTNINTYPNPDSTYEFYSSAKKSTKLSHYTEPKKTKKARERSLPVHPMSRSIAHSAHPIYQTQIEPYSNNRISKSSYQIAKRGKNYKPFVYHFKDYKRNIKRRIYESALERKPKRVRKRYRREINKSS